MTATDQPAFDYATVTCPMPECIAGLHLTWTLSRSVLVGDLKADFNSLPATDDAYAATWRVECEEGHVILVPGPAGCPCGDDLVSCPHGGEYDYSEDLRTFRVHDLDRLRAVLAMLGAGVSS